jgi:hypothetical protein
MHSPLIFPLEMAKKNVDFHGYAIIPDGFGGHMVFHSLLPQDF